MKRRPGSNRRGIRLPTSPPATGGGGGGGIVTAGLVLHLDANDATSYPGSGTAWFDLVSAGSGSPNKFDFASAPTDPFYNSEIGYFNFDNNSATIATPLGITPQQGAIEIWARWRGHSPRASALLLTHPGVNWVSLGYTNGTYGATNAFELNTDISAIMFENNGQFKYRDSQWHHFVVVIDGDGASGNNTMYVDGVPVPADGGGVPQPLFRSGSSISQGLMAFTSTVLGDYGGSYTFDGDMAVVRVYDTTGGTHFSAADVAQNYAVDSARFGAFQPDSIPSLTLWVDPSDDNTITYGTGTEIVEIADKALAVDRASFKAPFGSPNGPNIISDGGINWMQFAASDSLQGKKVAGTQALYRNDTFSSNNYEMHVVVKPTAVPSLSNVNPWTNNIIGPSDSSGYWGLYAKDVGSAPFIQPYNYSGNPTYGGFALAVNDKAIAGHSKSAGTSDLFNYKNGVATLVGNFGSSLGGGTGVLEFSGSGQDFIGQIGEVLIFNDELSASDRNDVITYLKAKWGIT